jgi:predicted hotdog family 3-hydroxylacyl-ACP dehydratase
MLNSARHEADPRILQLIPHRPPLLLIDQLLDVSLEQASALITITPASSFAVVGKGVPSWISLEYMGQTAALIAGYQAQQNPGPPQLGYILGTRRLTTSVAYFGFGSVLVVRCQQDGVVGNSLANFRCSIHAMEYAGGREQPGRCLAEASLSVYRQVVSGQ